MKKFTKILLGSILSVAMVVSGGLVFLNNNDAYAKVSINVTGYGAVSTSSADATVTTGTYAQITSGVDFTGLRLTGKSSATFDLGYVDIGSSDWAGTYSAVGAETETDKNESLLEMVFDPYSIENFSSTASELSSVTFTFTQGSEKLYVLIFPYAADQKQEVQITTRAGSQTDNGAYRSLTSSGSTNTKLTGGIRKGRIVKADQQYLGLPGTADLFSGHRGDSTVALPIYYDFNDVALYTPSQYIASAKGLNDSYLIRDYDSTEAIYNSTTSTVSQTWNGFTKDENGKCVVNVTATFGTVSGDNASSVIVTKLGGFDFSENFATTTGATKSVKTTAGAIANYGVGFNVGDSKAYSGLLLTGSNGATFDLGTINLSSTYFDDRWSYSKGTKNAVIAGTTTAYDKVSGALYTGGDASLGTANALASSFFSFVYNPSNTTQMELKQFSVTIREVDDLTTEADESENFITYVITGTGWTADGYSQESLNELYVNCMATNNSDCTAERYCKAGIQFSSGMRRQFDCRGSQSRPIGLYYDYSQNAAYTDIAFSGSTNDGLYSAFRVRDFDAVETNESDYQSIPTTISAWNGFSKEDANVNVTVTFDSVIEVDTTTLIVTSLGGSMFNGQQLAFDETVEVIKGDTVNLNTFAGYKTPTVTLAYENGPIAKYSVNDGEKFTNPEYTFDGETSYTVKFYDANDIYLGETLVEHPTIIFNGVNVTNGTYVIENNGQPKVIDNETVFLEFGDVVKLIPNNRSISNLILSDVRLFTLNGLSYNYDTVNVQNNEYLPAIWDNENEYYTLTIDNSVLENFTFALDVTFDRYCKITVQDEYVGEKVNHVWTMTDTFSLGGTSGNVIIYNSVNTGKSNGEKMLVAYARKDFGKVYGSEEVITRTDAFTYDTDKDGFLYYSGTALNNPGDDKTDNIKKAYCIIPDMIFEAIYVDFNIRTEIKLQDDGNGGVNENYSGLRFVIEVEREGWDKLKHYSKETDGENKSGIAFYNYITTKSQLEKANKNISNATTFGTSWMTGSWAGKLGEVNGLGLVCLNKDGEAYKGEIPDTAKGGFVYYGLAETSHDMWLDPDRNVNTDNENYLAYAITVRNFKDNTQTYLLSTLVGVGYVRGGNTGLIQKPVEINLAEECATKYTDVVNAGVDTPDGINRFKVSIDGVEKYYSLSYKHLQWLNEKGGLGHTIAESSTNVEE